MLKLIDFFSISKLSQNILYIIFGIFWPFIPLLYFLYILPTFIYSWIDFKFTHILTKFYYISHCLFMNYQRPAMFVYKNRYLPHGQVKFALGNIFLTGIFWMLPRDRLFAQKCRDNWWAHILYFLWGLSILYK